MPPRAGRLDRDAVLAALPEGLIVLGPDGRIVICNPAAERILAVPSGTLKENGLVPSDWRLVRDDGMPLAEEDHPARVAQRTRAAQRGEVIGMLRPDDSVVWLSVSAAPLPLPDSPNSCDVVCTFSDVTRPRQRELALLAREAQLLRALERAPFALWSADVRGRISFLAGAIGADAARRADLLGRPATDLFPDAAAFPADLQRALAGEKLTTLASAESRVFETRFYPAYDAHGDADGVSGISIDVTARVAAETEQSNLRDALRHTAEEWRTTFDAIDSPLLLLGADDTVRRVNRATRALWGQPFDTHHRLEASGSAARPAVGRHLTRGSTVSEQQGRGHAAGARRHGRELLGRDGECRRRSAQ